MGKGCTSPIIAGGRLYVMGWNGQAARRGAAGEDAVYCLNAADGVEIWKQTYPSPYQGRVRTGDEG